MSVSTTSPSRSTVAGRLRAAGCVFAEDEAALILASARTPAQVAAMVRRRTAGLPLEHVVGWAAFGGLRIAVDEGVFVPRRRTEFLAARAADRVRPGAVVVDLCCGSGAVGAAVAAALGRATLHAVDIDPAAVRCARRNVGPFGGTVHEGDLYDPLPPGLRGGVDVLVANAPYVPSDEIGLLPAEARDHEPLAALDGGADGLDVQRRVAAGAADWLAPGGSLLVETSDRQAARTVAILTAGGLDTSVVAAGDIGATVVAGRAP